MMVKKLVYLHTVASLPATFKTLSNELLSNVEIFHMVDETLLQNTIRANKLTKNTIRRLIGHLASAQEAGVDLVMVTCSSVGPAVDLGQSIIDIPVFRVDQPMADLAVQMGTKIGVAATLSTTLEPTAALIERRAVVAGKDVQVISKLCEGAFDAVISGDTATHDKIVATGLRELVEQSDVCVLAQASMARVVQSLSEEDRCIPILSSPRLAVEHLAKEISSL
jgi:Asp/Glu/hydantoin racemase